MTHSRQQRFDLAAYLRRVGINSAPAPDVATLFALHRAHTQAIPFENLDIQMGYAVSLDAVALQAKIIGQRRGGYCFEQNAVFAMALEAIGFAPLSCEARVRQGASGVRARTHMVLRVSCDGRDWLADVGFGGDGIIEPLAMDGEEVVQAGYRYRVAREGEKHVLQRARGDDWQDLFAILGEPVYPIDFEVANWYTSTHPQSAFVLNLTAQRYRDGARHILRNLTYTVSREGVETTRDIARADLVPLLRDVFAIDVPDDARFRALDANGK